MPKLDFFVVVHHRNSRMETWASEIQLELPRVANLLGPSLASCGLISGMVVKDR